MNYRISVEFFNELSGTLSVKHFWGRDRQEAEKRWKEYEENNQHQRVRSVRYP